MDYCVFGVNWADYGSLDRILASDMIGMALAVTVGPGLLFGSIVAIFIWAFGVRR